MNKYIYIIIGALLMITGTVFAVNITVPAAPTNGYVLTSTTTGSYIATTTTPLHIGSLYATSTTGNNYFAGTVTISTTTSGCLNISSGGVVYSATCSSGGGSFPFTTTTNFGQTAQSTTTALWLQAIPYSLFASSTSQFDNSTTTFATVKNLWLTNITGGQLLYGGGTGIVASVATGTISAGSSAITVTAGRSVVGGALAIDCATASGSQNGCLSSTDWSTFNGKAGNSYAANSIVTTNASGNLIATGTQLTVGNIIATTSATSYFLGNVGVGTTTPWAQLSVNPNALGSGVPEFAIGSSSTTHLVVMGNGNIGIATTTPIAQLSVNTLTGVDPFVIGSSTKSYFGVNQFGTINTCEDNPATSTTITFNWATHCSLTTYQVGISAFTINITNATTTYWAGSRHIIEVCNPGSTAGAITWTGTEWTFGGSVPPQTLSANACDIWSFYVGRATSSSSTYKVHGALTPSFQ